MSGCGLKEILYQVLILTLDISDGRPDCVNPQSRALTYLASLHAPATESRRVLRTRLPLSRVTCHIPRLMCLGEGCLALLSLLRSAAARNPVT